MILRHNKSKSKLISLYTLLRITWHSRNAAKRGLPCGTPCRVSGMPEMLFDRPGLIYLFRGIIVLDIYALLMHTCTYENYNKHK